MTARSQVQEGGGVAERLIAALVRMGFSRGAAEKLIEYGRERGASMRAARGRQDG